MGCKLCWSTQQLGIEIHARVPAAIVSIKKTRELSKLRLLKSNLEVEGRLRDAALDVLSADYALERCDSRVVEKPVYGRQLPQFKCLLSIDVIVCSETYPTMRSTALPPLKPMPYVIRAPIVDPIAAARTNIHQC